MSDMSGSSGSKTPETVATAELSEELLDLLTETFESPSKDGNAYLDRGTGLFTTLDAISAEDASRPPFPGATTVAAQTEHIRFYLVALTGFITGAHDRVDWDESWQLTTVTAGEWQRLREELRQTYEQLTALIGGFKRWDENELGGGLAILTHSAYHLGAIRQLVKALRG